MKKLLLFVPCVMLFLGGQGQEKKVLPVKEPRRSELPEIRKCIRSSQENLQLFTQNLDSHSQEQDVNSIILDIERYIDSMHKAKTYSDQLLAKNFMPLRHFFLTTTNKTTVAASFFFKDVPYQFCLYNDTALALYISAVKDGDVYNLAKTTERKVMKLAFENCLLPSLKACDEFKDNDIKYIALSIYYGCKDSRDGAPAGVVVPYCMTLVARLADVQQYAAGLITGKGLMTNGELYVSDEDDTAGMRRVQISTE